jgi:hypothetical protein
MSAPSLEPNEPSRQYPSGQYSAGQSAKHNLGKLAATLALITSGLAGLIIGIYIGNAVEKMDR